MLRAVKAQRETTNRKAQAETNPATVRLAMQRKINRKITGRGEVSFPCVPALLDAYMAKLAPLFDLLGKPFTEEELVALRKIIEGKLEKFYTEACLLEQPFIKDSSGKTKIKDLVDQATAKLGERVVVKRFARFQVGES